MLKSITYGPPLQHLNEKKDPWGITEGDGRIARLQDQFTRHDRRECYSWREKADAV